MKQHQTYILVIGLLLFAGYQTAMAQDAVDHRIVEIKRLVEAPEGIQWVNGRGNALEMGLDIPSMERVRQVKKASQYTHVGKNPAQVPETEKHNAIAVDMRPETGENNVAVKGKYLVDLPADLKHIQIELEYDLFVDGPSPETLNEFYVEIEEGDVQKGGWNKVAEIREPETVRRKDSARVFEMGDEKFTTHSYVADLSKWAGKTVQVVLASKNNTGKSAKGRWVQARLVGSTFSIKIGD